MSSERASRRQFLQTAGLLAAGSMFIPIAEMFYRAANPDQLCALDVCHNFANTETIDWIRKNSTMIVAVEAQYGVPPDLLSAIIYRENVARRIYPKVPMIGGIDINTELPLSAEMMVAKQWLATQIEEPTGVSVGLAQVQVATAQKLEVMLLPGRRFEDEGKALELTRNRLNSPWWNCAYAAYYLKNLMIKHQMTSDNLSLDDVIALGEEYNGTRSYGENVGEYFPYFAAYFRDFKDRFWERNFSPKPHRAHLGWQILVDDQTPELTHLYGSTYPVALVVVHHTASEISTPAGITLDHYAKGYGGMGYHGVIGNGRLTTDGEFIPGRNSTEPGVHAPPDNHRSVGIALVGNLNDHPPSESQLTTAARALAGCRMTYQLPPEALVTHGGLDSSTQCPGTLLDITSLRESTTNLINRWYEQWAEMGIRPA